VNGKKHFSNLIWTFFENAVLVCYSHFQIFELCRISRGIEGIVFSSVLDTIEKYTEITVKKFE
jgi:hypothetical protein